MKYTHVLFDLDGTLTDSSPGIINSIHYALSKMGLEERDEEKLRSFVGPGLKYTFRRNYFYKDTEVEEAVKHYRTYFSTKGIFENELYDGVETLLKHLKQEGVILALATAKPTYFANIILNHFGIRDYFEVVVGSHLNGKRTDKKTIIEEVLDQLGLPDKKKCLMVGDREYDIIGAQQHGIKSVGAMYGYGNQKELADAGVDQLIDSPLDLLGVFSPIVIK